MDLDVHLAAIKDRDPRAFALWMSGAELRIRDSLRSFATVVDVEAVLQESLLRVWHVTREGGPFVPDGRPDALLRFGVRVARNLAVSEVRRTKARPVSDDELEAAAAEDVVGAAPEAPDPMLRAAIERCRDKLPEQPRRALDARITGEAPADDIDLAAALGMRLNTFLQNFTRARRLLAECLAKAGVRISPELSA